MVELNVPSSVEVDEDRLPLPVGPTLEVEFDKGKGAVVVKDPSAEDVLKPPETVGG